jgi:adenosine deaminase
MNLHDFARLMPKVELHVHLEGAIRPATLLTLARRNGHALPVEDEAGLIALYRFRDFPHFEEMYGTIIGCLNTPADYELIAYEFGRGCAEQNVRYAEVTFTIASHVRRNGLPWQTILAGLNAGRTAAAVNFGVNWGWVFDIDRNRPETQEEVFEITLAAREHGAVALGLAGDEGRYPAFLVAETFRRAKAAGLPRVPHAGELGGPERVWETIRLLAPDRLGHGVRSIEDPALVAYLQERQLPLEVCPTSNIRLGVYPSYASHPLRRLWDAGLLLTVNSDDPPMFGADLVHEYEVLVDHFGFTADELERVSLNGIRASLLLAAEKVCMEREFRAEFASLRQTLPEDSYSR